jgi:hypothetical protein
MTLHMTISEAKDNIIRMIIDHPLAAPTIAVWYSISICSLRLAATAREYDHCKCFIIIHNL